MRQRWTETIKGVFRPFWYRTIHRSKASYSCPVCGYRGPFKDKVVNRSPEVVRLDSKCVQCGAAERHRIQCLVIEDLLPQWGTRARSILHIAPEFCLQPRLKELFGTYHTADLFREDVDFKEDIQRMTFGDGSYDCVYVSRVMTSIPDLEAAIREVRRILKPGGMLILSEAYIHEKSNEFGTMRGNRAREVGLDALDLCGRYFTRVDRILSNRYRADHQLLNRMRVGGQPDDNYPSLVRVPGEGYMELVAVCHA